MRLSCCPTPSQSDHKTVTVRDREHPGAAKLSRYLGRNAARMPFFRLKAVRRRDHGDFALKIDRIPFTDGRLAAKRTWNARNFRKEYGECIRFRRKKAVRSNLFAPPYLCYAPGTSVVQSKGGCGLSDEWRNDSSGGMQIPCRWCDVSADGGVGSLPII